MSRSSEDTTYKPKTRISGQQRYPSRKRQTGKINYSEVEEIESDTDSELTVRNSESGFGDVKQETESDLYLGEDTCTPTTFSNKSTQVNSQFARLTQENRELRMKRARLPR